MQNLAHIDHDLNSITKVGFRTFFKIANLWRLTPEQQTILLGMQDSHALNDRADLEFIEPVSVETILRINYVLGIYKQLNTLLLIASHADDWLKKPNSEILFNGATALDFLLKDPENHLPLLFAYLKTVTVDF